MAIHKVKKGETFSQIADRLGTSEAELRRLNKGVQTLSTGQGIKVPSLSASTKAGTYVPPKSPFQQFVDVMAGRSTYDRPTYQQAAAPASLTGVPLQSNNAVTASLVLGTQMPSYYQGPQSSIRPGLGVKSQMGGAMTGPNYGALSYRNPTFFSYAPQGQPNSYTPYKPAPVQPAPFLTSSMLANPTYGNAPQVGQFGNYANGTPVTTQEAFQQGKIKVGKRWWIGRGGNKSYETPVQPLAPIAPPEQIQTINWRV